METSKLAKTILVVGLIITLLLPNVCVAMEPIISGTSEEVQEKQESEVLTSSDEEESEEGTEQETKGDETEETKSEETKPEEPAIPEEDEIDGDVAQNLNDGIAPVSVREINSNNEIQTIDGVTQVKAGEETLQDAISKAQEGDILQLEKGDYTGSDIVIDKPITIRGAGANSYSSSKIISKIVVRGTEADTEVVLENLFLGNQQIPGEKGYKFINIESPVNIQINNVATSFAYRGNPDTEVFTLNMEKDSNGSTLNINNSSLYSAINGIKVESSKNNITLSNTFLYGKYAFVFSEGGKDNSLTIKEKSSITGRSSGYYADEAIQIMGQDGLKIDISDSEIRGNDARGDRDTHIFSFDGTKPSKNVTINIEGTTVINDVNPVKGSTIFNFGNSTPDSNNVIKIGKNVSMTPSTVEYKYSTSESYAIVGIYDEYGDATVKVYNKNQTIPEGDYDSGVSNWYKITSSTEDFDIENTPVNENMDLHPMPVRETPIKVKIQGQEQEYELNAGQTYTDNEELKTQLESLKDVQDKTFSSFMTQDGIKIDEQTKIYKDTTITPKYQVTVKIKNKDGDNDEYQIEEGQNLSYIPQEDLDKYEKETADNTKKFSRYRQIGSAKYLSVSKSIPIEKNIELEPVYYVTVTIKVGKEEKTYNIDENESLQSYYSTQATLTQIKEFVNGPNKEFQYFIVDEEDTHADYNTPISKHTTLTAKYKVKVTVYKADGTTKDYLLEEGQSLRSLGQNVIDEIEESVDNGKTIIRYVDGKGNEVDFDTQVYENINFEPVYYDKVKVKIKDVEGKEYELEDGANLNTLSEQDKNELMDAVNKPDKKLAYFTNAKGETITFETPITQDTELTPVYNVTITILPKNAESEEIEVLENTKFGDTKLQESLEKYKVDNKSLKGFIYEGSGEPVNNDDTFEKHTTIIPKYTITVTVKINANEEGKPINDVDEGATLESLEEQLKEYKNVDKKTLAKYVDSTTGREIPQAEQLIENITITPIYKVVVTINDKEYTLEENASLDSLEAEQLKEIREAIEVDNKTFSNFVNENGDVIDFTTAIDEDMKLTPKYKVTVKVVDEDGNTVLEETMPENDKLEDLGDKAIKLKQDLKVEKKVFAEEFTSDIDDNTYDFKTQITQNITLTPKYNVDIKIKGKSYTLPEGGKIQDLAPEEISEIETAVEAEGKTFKKQFVDEEGNVINYDTQINKNSTLTPKYNVTVTIITVDGDKIFTIEEGKKLSDIEEQEDYENTMKKDDRKFSRFVYIDENEVEQTFDKDNDTVDRDIILTPKFKVTVKVNDIDGNELKSVEIEEGETLASKSDELANVENPGNKTFVGYYEGSDKVEKSTAIEDNKTLVAKYEVTVQIGDQIYTVPEGTTIEQLKASYPEIEQELEDVKDADREFSRYVDENGNTIDDNTIFNVNTKILPRYKDEEIIEPTNPTPQEPTLAGSEEGTNSGNAQSVNSESITASPKTSDNIINYIALALISLVGIVVSIKLRKNNK